MTTTTHVQALRRARKGIGAAGGGPVSRKSKFTKQRGRIFALLIAPSVVLVLLINAYPLVYAAIQSVHNGSLLDTGPFVGLDNFAQILGSDAFWKATRFTLLFTIVGVFGSWLVGMGLAMLLRTRIPAAPVFKVLLLLPWVVPIVVSSTAWNWLLATPDSVVPVLARFLGFDSPLFLADPTLAVITVCVFKVWVSFPFMMLMASSALASVDQAVYEAADMDGANKWQQFTLITLPLIARTTYISWILMTIFCVNDFATIYLLTGGGPVDATTSVVVLVYRTVFQDFQTGTGVAMAFIMTVSLVLVSVVLYRQIRRSSVQE